MSNEIVPQVFESDEFGIMTEVGWREALRLAGIYPRELSAIGWRGWLKIIALLAVCWAAAWLIF